jgi:hypothetical protein
MGHPPPPTPVVVDSATTVGSTLGWMADADNGAAADEDDEDSVGRCLDWPTPMISE